MISSNLVLKLVLMRAIRENKRLTTAFPMGRRILDCRLVPDGEVGHARVFVCFSLILSINLRLGSLKSSWVGSPHDLKN